MFRAPVPMTLLYEDGHVTELVEAQRPVNVGVTKACCTELIASSSDNPVVSISSPVLTMHALSARATIAPDAHRTVVVMPSSTYSLFLTGSRRWERSVSHISPLDKGRQAQSHR